MLDYILDILYIKVICTIYLSHKKIYMINTFFYYKFLIDTS